MPLSPPPVTAATPPFPEAALRAVLAGTVAAWAEVPSAGDEPRRLYLDAFAGAEFQFGTGVERAGDEETRAGAAVRALGWAGAAPPVALFVEEDPAHLGRIYAELEDTAGGERLRATRDLASLAPGEVSLLESPFASVAADFARFAAGARTFVFAAPPAARALPWDALKQVAAAREATVLIRFPHSDFEKQGRHTGTLADLPAFARRMVEGCSALLDDPKHSWLPAWRADAAGGQAAALAGVLERFRTLLDGAAGGRILKPMELETKGGARTWLFLVTPDPAVALAANAAVRAAKLADRAAAAGPIATATEDAGDRPAAARPSASAEPKAAVSPGGAGEASDGSATTPPRKGRRASKSSPAALPPAASASRESEPSAPPAPPSSEPAATPRGTTTPDATGSPAVPATAPANAPADDAAGPSSGPASPEESSPAVSARAPSPPAESAPSARPPARPRAQPVAEVLDLFAEPVAAPEYVLASRPEPAAIAADLEARFAGSTVAWREILRAFAATDVTPAELKSALAVLRRGGRASYKALKADDDAVEFPAEPVAREKPKRRRKAADDGGFFGGAEDEGGEGDAGAGEKGD